MKINVLSLFDGLSCGQISLDQLGLSYKYYASEIDPYCIAVSSYRYPKTIHLGDIEKIDLKLLPKVDLLIGGSPCQDISCLKNGKGLEGDKSRLLKNYIDILNKLKPKYFILENVVPRKKEWKDQIDKLTGVEGVFINSDLFVEQNRPRIYWTNINIDKLPDRPEWNGKYYQFRRTYFRENKSSVCPCLTANMGTGGHNVPLKSMNLKDKLLPVECERLQGIPDNFTLVPYKNRMMSNTQRYKMIGNGFTVPVIKHILRNIHVQ